jgi:glucan-binding YG repeat protein
MHFRKVLPVLVAAVSLSALPAMMQTRPLAAADTDEGMIVLDALLPDEQLSYDENGDAYYAEGDEIATGKFSLKPNFLLGDVNNDGNVDVADAANVLKIAAEMGSKDVDAAARIVTFADINGDGIINSLDAAAILEYSAEGGAKGSSLPMGTTYYFADPQGKLLTGIIEDVETGEFYYADEEFHLLTGWISNASGYCFYLNEDGTMLMNGWAELPDGTKCWLDSDGSILKNSWLDTAEGYYYLDKNGNPVTGEQTIGGKDYVFDQNGIRMDGMIETDDGKTVVTDESGALLSGWQEIDGKRYYFDPDSGEMLKGCWIELDGQEYFLDADGAMLTGWQIITPYTYYLGEDGAKQTGLVTVNGKVFYLNEVGIREAGWKLVDGVKHYFFPVGCYMATGWQTIDGVKFYFYEDGTMAADTEIDGQKIQANGYTMSDLLCEATVKIQSGIKEYGTTPDSIFDYMRATNRYKKTEATKTLDELNAVGWTFLVNYATKNYYTVCYYMAAKMDYICKLMGYTSRIVHSTHGTGDHYWNQVLIGEEWVNYDPTNNLKAYTWDQIVAYGNYIFLGYVEPEYI